MNFILKKGKKFSPNQAIIKPFWPIFFVSLRAYAFLPWWIFFSSPQPFYSCVSFRLYLPHICDPWKKNKGLKDATSTQQPPLKLLLCVDVLFLWWRIFYDNRSPSLFFKKFTSCLHRGSEQSFKEKKNPGGLKEHLCIQCSLQSSPGWITEWARWARVQGPTG